MSDKCYICHETEGILRKTCKNKRCKAKTHSPCLEKQYITLKKCGFCKSDIIINSKFNYWKLINFLFTKLINLIKFIFMVFIFILHSYLIFMIIMGLNPLNPLNYFGTESNNIAVITKHNKHNKDISNYIIFTVISIINFIIHMDFLFEEDKLLEQLKLFNDKYGKTRVILWCVFLEIIFSLINHILGYYASRIFLNENIEFYTYETFSVGTISSLFILFISSLTYGMTNILLLPLLEPFYDKQFGQ